MKYLPILLLLITGCTVVEKVWDVTRTVAPPVAEIVSPGLGTIVGAITGGVSIIGGGIAALIIKKKRKKWKNYL